MGRKPECRDDHGWSRAALEGHGDGMDAGGRAMQEQLPDGRERPALPTDWRRSFLRLSGLAAWMHAPKNAPGFSALPIQLAVTAPSFVRIAARMHAPKIACFVCRDQHLGARAEKCILHFRRAGARVPRRPWMAERGWHCHQLATIAPSLFGISGVDARAEKCSCIFGIAAIHGGKKNGSICSRQNKR